MFLAIHSTVKTVDGARGIAAGQRFFPARVQNGGSDDVTRGLELATAAIGRSINANAAP
jgi:hypothetical protein